MGEKMRQNFNSILKVALKCQQLQCKMTITTTQQWGTLQLTEFNLDLFAEHRKDRHPGEPSTCSYSPGTSQQPPATNHQAVSLRSLIKFTNNRSNHNNNNKEKISNVAKLRKR